MNDAKILDLNDKLQRGELTDSPRDRARQMVGYNGSSAPHSALAERSVLADALDGGGTGLALLRDVLEPKAFFLAAHQKIAAAVRDRLTRREAIDRVTVGPALDLDVDAVVPSQESRNVEAHGRTVFELWQIREMGRVTADIATHCKGPIGDARAVLDRARIAVAKIADRDPYDSTIAPMGPEIVAWGQRLQQEAEERRDRLDRGEPEEGPRMIGLTTGFSRLDAMTRGMQDGQLWILGASTGGGKTSLALNMLIASSAIPVDPDQSRPGLIFSGEMFRRELAERMVSSQARFDLRQIAYARQEHWQAITRASSFLTSGCPIDVDDTRGIDIRDLKSRARRVADTLSRDGKRLGLLVVDYLQLVQRQKASRDETREQSVSQIARDLKNLAGELKCPILALSQVKREVRKENRRPRFDDLRESGDIENAADLVALLWPDTQSDIVRIVVDKQRAGPIGIVACRFQRSITRFDEVPEHEAMGWENQ